jgi:carboxylesterase
MEHKEYKRIIDTASVAILFIHGIVGTPDHFDKFISLIPDDVSIYNMLLDGHGKGVRDFSHTSMQKWEDQVTNAVTELSRTHEKIYIVAHSMGSLFAIDRGMDCEKVRGLFLLAAPIKLFLRPKMIRNSIKVYRNKIKPDDKEALAAKACYGIASDKNPFHYITWAPRYFELFAKIKRTRKRLSELDVPCSVYLSRRDEMVSVKSAVYLHENPHITVKWLESSGHYYYSDSDFVFLLNEFKRFIRPT